MQPAAVATRTTWTTTLSGIDRVARRSPASPDRGARQAQSGNRRRQAAPRSTRGACCHDVSCFLSRSPSQRSPSRVRRSQPAAATPWTAERRSSAPRCGLLSPRARSPGVSCASGCGFTSDRAPSRALSPVRSGWTRSSWMQAPTPGRTCSTSTPHQVDFYSLHDSDRARLNRTLGGSQWWWGAPSLAHAAHGCERFASTLAWAYWPSKRNALRPQRPADESAAMEPRPFRALLTTLLGGRREADFRR